MLKKLNNIVAVLASITLIALYVSFFILVLVIGYWLKQLPVAVVVTAVLFFPAVYSLDFLLGLLLKD